MEIPLNTVKLHWCNSTKTYLINSRGCNSVLSGELYLKYVRHFVKGTDTLYTKFDAHCLHILQYMPQMSFKHIWHKLGIFFHISERLHYSWSSWCIKSLATWLFVQELVQANNERNVQALHYWLFMREILNLICNMCLEITFLELLPYLPRTSELKQNKKKTSRPL